MKTIAPAPETSPTTWRFAGTISASCNRNSRVSAFPRLGRTESHVLDAFQTVYQVLTQLLGSDALLPLPAEAAVGMGEGAELLEKHTETLLGPAPPGRTVRIMVTMATEAATDYELVRDLVQSGMDCMRINCAHDNPDLWLGMIKNLERARQETGRNCRVLMDIAGPKLRTGPVEPGAAVVKCRPSRDIYGRVVAPARVWLTSGENVQTSPAEAAATLPVPLSFLEKLRAGDTLRLHDARKEPRTLHITHVDPRGAWAESRQTIYFVPGLELQLAHREALRKTSLKVLAKARIGKLPHRPQALLLMQGDTLVLTRANTLGKPALYDKSGAMLEPAQISVSLPEILDHAKVGEPVWFDDGKIGGVIRAVNNDSVSVEISQARPQGEKLAAEKGINLPETQIDIPALTEEDSAVLPFIVEHADLIGYSFVRTEAHVRQLLDRLDQLGGRHLGLVLKIETRKGF